MNYGDQVWVRARFVHRFDKSKAKNKNEVVVYPGYAAYVGDNDIRLVAPQDITEWEECTGSEGHGLRQSITKYTPKEPG